MSDVAPMEAKTSQERRRRRIRQGVVVSDVRAQTIKVINEYSRPHPKYGKIIRRRRVLHAHDPNNLAKKGDVVEIMSCRRISKQKAWRLVRIVAEAGRRAPLPELPADPKGGVNPVEGRE